MVHAANIKNEDIKTWVDEKMNKQRLPLPARPQAANPEFSFPEDPSLLSSIEVGQWMARFTAYLTYTARLLGNVESELVAVDAEYRLKINMGRDEVMDNLPKRPAAEVVEAEVLRRTPEITPLYERRLKLLAVKAQLMARITIFERSYQAMSRELSRREMEARTA